MIVDCHGSEFSNIPQLNNKGVILHIYLQLSNIYFEILCKKNILCKSSFSSNLACLCVSVMFLKTTE